MEEIKPWYRHPWRIAGILLAGLTLIGLGMFTWRTFYFYKEIKKGKTFEQALAKSGEKKPLDQNQIRYLDSVKEYVKGGSTDPYAGPASSAHEMVVFIDYDCPFSKQMIPVIRDFMKAHPDVKITVQDFPVADLHPQSMLPAKAARCIWSQGKPDVYWAYHDRLFSEQVNHKKEDLRSFAGNTGADIAAYDQCMSGDKMEAAVRSSETLGSRAGVRGTPTFFVDGSQIEGVVEISQLESLLR